MNNKEKTYIQLNLIKKTEAEKLHEEFLKVKESSDKVRRGVFSKQSELSKKFEEMKCEIESLKSQLEIVSKWIEKTSTLVENVQTKEVLSRAEQCQRTTCKFATSAKKKKMLLTSEISDMKILTA